MSIRTFIAVLVLLASSSAFAQLLTEKKFFTLPQYTTAGGKTIKNVRVGYETYGKLNAAGDNAIFVAHFFSGTSHAAGRYKADEKAAGYWDAIIGPGKAIDTDKYFVVSADTLANLNVKSPMVGTTGPATVNPDTGKPYGSSFPVVSMKDSVRVHKALVDSLGLAQPLTLLAHDWGGAAAWSLAAQKPHLLRRLLIVNSPHPATFLRELRDNPAQQAASAYMNFLCRSDAAEQLARNDFERLWPFFTNMGGAAWLTDALRAQYRALWQRGLEGPLNYYRASPLKPAQTPADAINTLVFAPELVTVKLPTTVLWGEADTALPLLHEVLGAAVVHPGDRQGRAAAGRPARRPQRTAVSGRRRSGTRGPGLAASALRGACRRARRLAAGRPTPPHRSRGRRRG